MTGGHGGIDDLGGHQPSRTYHFAVKPPFFSDWLPIAAKTFGKSTENAVVKF
jgi:hypothetical protein